MSLMPYKRALVTGGAGFIGSHIADALIKRRIKTYVIDDLTTGDKKNVNPNAEFVKMSITSPAFPALLKKIQPDIVFHTAAQVNVRSSVVDPVTDAKVNVLGTLALIQHAAEAGVKKIVFSSSGGAMFSDRVRPPYSESQPAEPVSPYGISKRAGEMYLEFASSTYGIDTVSLRYANVYGPRQNTKGEAGVVALFGSHLLANEDIIINGDGKQTRDFVYVGDVVRANVLAMGKNAHGIYHIGTGQETSVLKLFKMMNRLTAASAPLLTKEGSGEVRAVRGSTMQFGPAKAGEVRRSALVSKKAMKELGWKAEMSLEEGLRKTLKSLIP